MEPLVSPAGELKDFVALLGGSFNPPHIAHQMACLYLLEGLGARRVWLLPAFKHPFGKALVSFDERVAMCELMAQPFAGRVKVSRVEAELGGLSRTFDTLAHLFRLHPKERFALVVGSDILQETERWYRWEEIKELVRLVVLARAGFPTVGADTAPVVLPELSSSLIRERLARGASVAGMLPTAVAAYIEERGLIFS